MSIKPKLIYIVTSQNPKTHWNRKATRSPTQTRAVAVIAEHRTRATVVTHPETQRNLKAARNLTKPRAVTVIRVENRTRARMVTDQNTQSPRRQTIPQARPKTRRIKEKINLWISIMYTDCHMLMFKKQAIMLNLHTCNIVIWKDPFSCYKTQQ